MDVSKGENIPEVNFCIRPCLHWCST